MATKGWSFGALTDALRSAAFTETGNGVGRIPVITPAGNLFINPNNTTSNGVYVAGADSNQIGIWQSRVNSDTPKNGFANMLECKWQAAYMNFGILRGTDASSLGYAIDWNGQQQYMYRGAESRHKLRGSVHSTKFEIGPQDVTTTGGGEVWASLQSPSETQITLKHQSHAWTFNSAGGIEFGSVAGNAGIAAVRVQPPSGNWESGNSSACGLQIDLTGANASTIWRATVWGSGHISWMNAANSGTPTARWYVGNNDNFLTFSATGIDGALTLSNGGFRTNNGSIVASTYVRAGGGSSVMHPDGNLEGPIWGGYLSNWINSNFCKAVRLWGRTVIRDSGGRVELPAGCVYVGMSGSNYNPETWASYAQVQYLIGSNWVNVKGN